MNLVLIIISGLLTGLSFPARFGQLELPNLGFLAWFSLAPLFFAIRNSGPRKTFWQTFLALAIANGISLYWLYIALHTFGKIDLVTSAGVLALLIILESSFVSVAAMGASFVERKLNISKFWTLPIFWVVGEIARNYFPFNGFPWGNITNTQYAYLPIIQIADLGGIYLLTYLMIAVNMWFSERPKYLSVRSLFVTVLVVSTICYGYFKLATVSEMQATWNGTKIALLQGNIPQDEKWRPGLESEQLRPYTELTQSLKGSNVDLLIWPETSFPWVIDNNTKVINPELTGLDSERIGDPFLLLGAVTINRDSKDRELFNSMLLVDKEGHIISRYHKMHLVPFGEYVPMKKILSFASKLTEKVGSMEPGGDQDLLFTDKFRVGGLICYEDLFPEVSRKMALKGADFLAAITNDAWYELSSAAKQHLAISVFRAVETRRWLVKAANTGVSATIDATGKVISSTRLFERGMIVSNVKLADGYLSYYTRFGDWFAYACVIVMAILLLVSFGRRKLP